MRRLAAVLCLVVAVPFLPACGLSNPTGFEPESEVEIMLLSETARFASLMNVKVRGEIVERYPWASSGQPIPTAWYEGGVAYYYRSMVKLNVSIEVAPGKETATNVAAHEVCHAKTGSPHDRLHWDCMNTYAFPTYPKP